MLAPTRHRHLLDLLSEQGSVRTTEVAKKLGVTEETIRRDFEKLEKEGALLRAHGGAICLDVQKREMPVKDRAAQNSAAKKAIAQLAIRTVEPGQTIFLDPSTTVQQMARLIPDIPLTIITSSLQIPDFFAAKPAVQVIVLGGNFRASSRSCTGYAAELTCDLFRVDSAYVSCRGVDSQYGLSEATEDQARLKRHIRSRTSNFFLLADTSKANVTSTHFFAKIPEVTTWFVEAAPEAKLASGINSQGVRIEVASEPA